MSQSESELDDGSSDAETQDGDGENTGGTEVAVARPPLSGCHSMEFVVSGQAALDTLDEMQSNGLIGREKASNLQRKYLALKETLESSRAAEATLLAQVKQLGQVVHQQSVVLEKGDSFPEGDSGESSRLRKILLNYTNQLEQSNQRQTVLDNHLNSVEEEHTQISRELDRLPREADINSKLSDLNRELEDLRDEIRKRNKDMDRYGVELSIREQRLASILKETEELRRTEDSLQNELMQLRSAPGNLPREIDTLIKRYRDSKQQVAESDSHLSQLFDHLKELQTTSKDREMQVRETGKKLVDVRGEGGRLNDMLRQAENSLAQAKERQVALLEQQASLELALRHKNTDFSRLYESLASLSKENESIAKQVKRAELCSEAVRQAESQLLLRLQTLETRIGEGELATTDRQQRQKEARQETDNMRKALSMQEGVSTSQRAMLEGKQAEEEKMREKLTSLSSKLQQLTKEVVALTKQKDQDSRACHQSKVSELGMKANLYTKESQLREEKKTVAALQKKFADSAMAYKLIKTERNHTHSQIHRLQQLSSEMKEKRRILENEIEVLMATAQEKNRLLQRCDLVQSTKSVELESQRQLAGKLALETAQTRADLETQRECLTKLTQNVTSLERQLQQMRRNYEHALQERNDSGLQLIERNEEVCVFHERLNMQEAVLRQANLDLMSREEELRYLQLEVTQLKRQILVSRKTLPEQSNLQLTLKSSQKQLAACEDKLKSLEEQVENAQDPARIRLLGGPQTSQEEYLEQLESLERKLASQEQTGLEKELLYEQICKLVNRLQTRTTVQEQSTLQVAQKVGTYQTRIRDTSRKTMALVSELTMQQANALRLQQEVSEKETAVERAYTRLEAGQPPDSLTELQWQKIVRDEQTKKLKCEVEENEEIKVEPRPNAYLPTTDGELPVPKPYGNHAPFKPSPAGANMRHIRKPQPKPIDI